LIARAAKKGTGPFFWRRGTVPSGSGLVVKKCDFYPSYFPYFLRIRPDPMLFEKRNYPIFSKGCFGFFFLLS
jgi:hypothetical protein